MRIRYIVNKLKFWAETKTIFSKIPKYAAKRDSFRQYWRETWAGHVTHETELTRRARRAIAKELYRISKHPPASKVCDAVDYSVV